MSQYEKKKPGRPKKGDEYPVERIQARACRACGEMENFKSNRGAVVVGIVKVEWLRCQACKKVTRFETVLK
jgi:hypothetical protein